MKMGGRFAVRHELSFQCAATARFLTISHAHSQARFQKPQLLGNRSPICVKKRSFFPLILHMIMSFIIYEACVSRLDRLEQRMNILAEGLASGSSITETFCMSTNSGRFDGKKIHKANSASSSVYDIRGRYIHKANSASQAVYEIRGERIYRAHSASQAEFDIRGTKIHKANSASMAIYEIR